MSRPPDLQSHQTRQECASSQETQKDKADHEENRQADTQQKASQKAIQLSRLKMIAYEAYLFK